MIKTLTIEQAFVWAVRSLKAYDDERKRMGDPAPPPSAQKILDQIKLERWWSGCNAE